MTYTMSSGTLNLTHSLTFAELKFGLSTTYFSQIAKWFHRAITLV